MCAVLFLVSSIVFSQNSFMGWYNLKLLALIALGSQRIPHDRATCLIAPHAVSMATIGPVAHISSFSALEAHSCTMVTLSQFL